MPKIDERSKYSKVKNAERCNNTKAKMVREPRGNKPKNNEKIKYKNTINAERSKNQKVKNNERCKYHKSKKYYKDQRD